MKKSVKFFLIVVLTFSLFSCQKQKEEGYYKTALEDIKNNNIESAIKNFEKLIELNPYSDYAPDAFLTLASLYQTLEGDSLQTANNYKKAIHYYNELIEKFPNYSKTPEAIFMAGFISAENLKDYDQARLYYKKFLKAYPEHELASSVQAELDNLGKSPEQILKEKGVQLGDKGMSK